MTIIACVIDGCERKLYTKFICNMHYLRMRRTGTTNPSQHISKECRMPSCVKPSRKIGWCSSHHSRIKRNGTPFDKGQNWTVGERGPCVVCGDPTIEGSGLRRYCGWKCVAAWHAPERDEFNECHACGVSIDLSERHASGRLRYSSASRCDKCRAPRLTHLVPILAERDGLDCHLCRAPIDLALAHPDPMSRSVDHVIPRSKGGPDAMENYRLSHLTCNLQKGNRLDWAPA